MKIFSNPYHSIRCITKNNRMKILSPQVLVLSFLSFFILFTSDSHAMHISEGILPLDWAAIWFLVMIPFLTRGLYELNKRNQESHFFKPMVALIGAAVFILSCMPIPIPVVGSTSHICGSAIAAIFLGPHITVVLASIILLLQALFLAHGGLSALGADIVSMGVAGGFSGFLLYHGLLKLKISEFVAVLLASTLSSWIIYGVTAVQLAIVLQQDSFFSMFIAIVLAFVPTQLPLGIFEGLISAGAYRFLNQRRPDLFRNLTMIKA